MNAKIDTKPIANEALPEIEVTPEMIAAGGAVLWNYGDLQFYLGPGAAEDLAEKVILSALAVARKQTAPVAQPSSEDAGSDEQGE